MSRNSDLTLLPVQRQPNMSMWYWWYLTVPATQFHFNRIAMIHSISKSRDYIFRSLNWNSIICYLLELLINWSSKEVRGKFKVVSDLSSEFTVSKQMHRLTVWSLKVIIKWFSKLRSIYGMEYIDQIECGLSTEERFKLNRISLRKPNHIPIGTAFLI
jgi:hypothetical protein